MNQTLESITPLKKPKTQPGKPTYKLTVKIGKIKKKNRHFVFKTSNPVEALLSIDIPKMMEEVTFILEKDGKVATRSMNAFKARRIFNDKLNAFYLIKNMHFIFKKSSR